MGQNPKIGYQKFNDLQTAKLSQSNFATEPLDVASQVTREVVVRPANEPEHAVVARLAEVLEHQPGLLQLDVALGDMARPRRAPWAERGVDIMARPWPQSGTLVKKDDFTLDFAHGMVTWPGGQTVPMGPGQDAPLPANACAGCPQRAQGTKARIGHGRSRHSREDEPFQPTLRAKINTTRGRASRRQRTAVAQAISHQGAQQGRRAHDKGLREEPV